MTAINDKTELPHEFSINQNYPNPFNPITTIQYSLKAQQHAALKVYNLLGNEIAVLVDEVKPAGFYEVSFDATNLPSGIYFYKLETDSFVETKKMTLLR